MIEFTEVIGSVTQAVKSETGGLQTPWVARSEMFGDFALAPAP